MSTHNSGATSVNRRIPRNALSGLAAMLLIGGDLLTAGAQLMEKSRDFVRRVAEGAEA